MSSDIFEGQGLKVTAYTATYGEQKLQFDITDGTEFTQIDEDAVKELVKALVDWLL